MSWNLDYEMKADGRVGFDPGMATADRAEFYRTMADFNLVLGSEVDAHVSHAISLMLTNNKNPREKPILILEQLWRG